MRCSLSLTALVATFTLGSCQFQFLKRRDGTPVALLDHAVSSRSFVSTSWFRGQDGQMHQQTKTSSTQFGQDGSQMKKITVCRDGHCREVTETTNTEVVATAIADLPIEIVETNIQDSPSPFLRGSNGGGIEPRARMRAILDRMFGHMQQQRQQQPEIIIEPMRQRPEIIIEQMGGRHEMIMIPFQHGNPRDIPKEFIIPMEEYRPQVQRQEQQKTADLQASDMKLIKVGVALFALGAAYAMVMSALKCWRVDRVSARERPLRDLSEPLAPASTNVAIPAAARGGTRKFSPVRTYLSDLYARANAKNEARGVTTYLARLYTRIVA